MNLLEVSDLIVEHGTLRALWDVNLAVAEGERVGLLGTNGAGKSTTLGSIIGLYPPVSGEIRFAGESITRKRPRDIVHRGVALVPEGRHLFSEMSVRENLEIGAYLPPSRTHVERRLEEVFAQFPILATKAAQKAGQLSGGQQQMLAIGRALMSAPRLLLLDEPFIGVAPIIVNEVMGALRDVSRQGVTILLVEQNIHRALDLVERAYVIENGRTVLMGSRAELLGDSGFGAKFLGLQSLAD